MRAIILAAGRGSRMQSLTDDRPKCLVEFRGKTLLDWQLAALRGAGLEEIGIVTGYRREMLANHHLTEFHNPRWYETNMVSSLACANDWLKSDTCIVSYSDIFYESEAVRHLLDCKALLAVTYDANWRQLWERRFENPLDDAETFRMNPDGSLAEIGNKPDSIESVEGQYMGLLRITPEGWKEISRIRNLLSAGECDRMHMTGTLQRVIQEDRVRIAAVPYRGDWGEVDSAADLDAYASK